MSEGVSEKVRLAEAVRRRTRLARLPKMTVGPYRGDDFDVRVVISPPDADLAATFQTLCPDIRLKILQGAWERA